MSGKGVFVCVEGLDGCGKTTQAKLLVRRLKRMGYVAVYTAEPSRGKIGKLIREHYLHCEKRASIVVEALLFAADRVEHVEREVLPALKAGKVVVSDRYVYSSLAYQGAGGLDLDWIQEVNKGAVFPDLAVFIDVAPETAIGRLKAEKSVMENLEFQRKVREVYLKFVGLGPLVRVDGNGSEKEVADEILDTVVGFLKKSG
ncbi:MAG TPA: dTMP kinase [Candidatus Bathyarchaeia archaeon]